jgi:hypothetical protein
MTSRETGIKTCPLCQAQRWASDGKLVVEFTDYCGQCEVFGYSLEAIHGALEFATERGWRP